MKKVLIVTPRSPFQGRGADELDRLSGIEWFIAEGYEVKVITKTMNSDVAFLEGARKRLGIEIVSVPYKFANEKNIVRRFFRGLLDGASFEYSDSEIQHAVKDATTNFKPDLVWFDYSYLWRLYKYPQKAGIPIVTRSINMEPLHFLDEDGKSFFHYLWSIPKWMSEWIVSQKSDLVLAITPNEQKIYQKLGAKSFVMPLRGLAKKVVNIPSRTFYDLREVHIGFAASNYNVSHNEDALLFLVTEVMPLLRKEGRACILHFTGSKVPVSIQEYVGVDVVEEGFVDSMEEFWSRMDIAVVPSLFGAGMQQKVFEPIALGVPTITSKRAIAGYPFSEQEVLFADKPEEFVSAILYLATSTEKRMMLSKKAATLSRSLFSESAIFAEMKKQIDVFMK